MDLYITDSLQDMLDIDIKSEIATDLNSISDFSVRTILNIYFTTYFFNRYKLGFVFDSSQTTIYVSCQIKISNLY